jgi:hypothetical protein
MAGLNDKWGSKEAWLRSLYLRASIIWIFRQEIPRLELGQLRWLGPILEDAYLVTTVQAGRYTDNNEAFDASIDLVRNNIEQRLASLGADAELHRLLKLTRDARPCDAIRQLFHKLAKDAHNIYRTGPPRKIQLQCEWLSGHPRGATSPGTYPDPYHLNAQTKVQEHRSLIELQIHLDEFDVPGLLAIPALLTHELVCHAYADEDCNDLQSIWAEGVMDWVALFFFERWSLHLDLPYARIKSHGEKLWEQRMSPARYTGRDIANRLVEWLVKDTSVRGLNVAQQVTAKFALEVNVAAASLLAKDSLASRIANIRTDIQLQQAFRDWRAGARPAAEMIS